MRTVVYILAQDPDSERTAMVERLFDNELFVVHVVNIAIPRDQRLTSGPGITANQAVEAYRVTWCLRDAKERYPDLSVAVIKDTSVSNADSTTIADIVNETLQQPGWHLCYLCKWHDRCDLYTNKKVLDGRSTIIAKSHSPHGVQAILFSVEGRDIILGARPLKNGQRFPEAITRPIGLLFNEAIMDGALDAVAVVPNLIEFDVNAARSNADFAKLSECRNPNAASRPVVNQTPNPTNVAGAATNVAGATNAALANVAATTANTAVVINAEAQDSGWGSWIWILVAIIIVIVIGWALVKLSQRKNNVISNEAAAAAVLAANGEASGVSFFA